MEIRAIMNQKPCRGSHSMNSTRVSRLTIRFVFWGKRPFLIGCRTKNCSGAAFPIVASMAHNVTPRRSEARTAARLTANARAARRAQRKTVARGARHDENVARGARRAPRANLGVKNDLILFMILLTLSNIIFQYYFSRILKIPMYYWILILIILLSKNIKYIKLNY